MSEYISAVETAKLIRVQLKNHFPSVKFSVKTDSYSMGASIRISWTNGPTRKQVEQITAPFSGSGFDGMNDLKYNKTSYLMPDGSARFGNSFGSGGEYHNEKPDGAREVDFGADYIFCSRDLSPAAEQAFAEAVAAKYGVPVPEKNAYGRRIGANADSWDRWFNEMVSETPLAG